MCALSYQKYHLIRKSTTSEMVFYTSLSHFADLNDGALDVSRTVVSELVYSVHVSSWGNWTSASWKVG